MKTSLLILSSLLCLLHGQSSAQSSQPQVVTPYGKTTPQDVKLVMDRILNYVDQVTPIGIVSKATGEKIIDLRKPMLEATLAKGEYNITGHEWGLAYMGMLRATESTGDQRFYEYVSKRFDFLSEASPYFRAHKKAFTKEVNPLEHFLFPGSLDDTGSMCAAMIQGLRSGMVNGLRPEIDNSINYIMTGVPRLPNGTFARNRPMPNSVWVDDLYQGIPALAQMGKFTGEQKYYDEAAKQVILFSELLFDKSKGVCMHGWIEGMDPHPAFFWARANGWAILAVAALLDVLPKDHPQRSAVLEFYRAYCHGLVTLQSPSGFWHQLLDRNDTFLETSATAMFTYAFAHGVNQGWLDLNSYGPPAMLGWNAVSTKVNDKGQVEGTTAGTGIAFDAAFYQQRPVGTGPHGYGSVTLAGAAMYKLLKEHTYEPTGPVNLQEVNDGNMKKSYSILLIAITLALPIAGSDCVLPNTVIIPASAFLEDLPKGDIIADATSLNAPWLFNNTALVLKSLSNLMTSVTIPADGTYYLFVRSQGDKGSSFKIAVNDKVTETNFGNDKLAWKQGGSFDLKMGTVALKITRINPGASVDVIVLTKNPSLKEEDIISCQLNSDVVLLKEYKVPQSNDVKFGDVNGDGLTDFMVLAPDFSTYVFDNSGKELWSWKAPEEYTKERSEFEAPGVVWDFDKDGKAEVVHWRITDEKEWLTIADGATGQVRSQVAWPTKPLPHVYNNFRLAIGKLTSGDPNEIVVFTDMGGTIRIDAYTSTLTPLWNHTELRKKDNLGHYVYPVDFNGDGVDEVLVGSLLLDSKGKMLWNRFDLLNDNHDHADNYKFADIDKDGHADIVTANSETGVFIYKALTGQVLWQNVAEHSQQIEAGNFLKNRVGPQVVVGARTYGNREIGEPYLSSQLYWFSNTGEMLFKWPGTPINGNPDFVKGDWRGDGTDQLFWFKFMINDSGKGEFYFPDPVFHMFDFTGKGADEVITLSRGVLRVYGSKNARYTQKDKKKNLLYLKNVVVNHTHY